MVNLHLFLLLLTVFSALCKEKDKEEKDNLFVEHPYKGPRITVSRKSAHIVWDVFNAQVNNFDATDNSTFAMRYIRNLQFCQQDGCPIVIFMGGEWNISEGNLQAGQIFETGRENGAAMFYTEHRFYGKSMPTNDLTVASLSLLHSSQALEDLKGFIMMLKASTRYANSKVMLFGCSYTGALVAWMKQRYPELIQVIYSTSGPFQAQDNMYEYYQVTSKLIYELPYIGKACYEVLFNGIHQLEEIYNRGEDGASWVRDKLRICPPSNPKGIYDRASVFSTFGFYFSAIGQSNPERLPAACNALVHATGDTYMDKLISYYRAYLSSTSTFCDRTNYESSLTMSNDTSLRGMENVVRQWFYQQCNEFGFFQTTETNTQAFGTSVRPFYFHQLCRDSYGARFTDEYILQAQQQTNANYGGRYPKVRKALFVYGSLDPWAPLGVTESLNDEALRFYIEGGAHCQDMLPADHLDSQSMTETRFKTRAWINKWLSE